MTFRWAALVLLLAASKLTGDAAARVGARAGQGAEPVRYGPYAAVLAAHLSADGFVDYVRLKQHRAPLDLFVGELSRVDSTALAGCEAEGQMAFWLNAYNALTLKLIVDHYPIRPTGAAGGDYPANSIQQIPGVWDDSTFAVAGRRVSLNDIEHNILRARFAEPRVHMALVCASLGCPRLRHEPFTTEGLDAQLDDQSRRFLKHTGNFRIDRARGIVYVSSIFDWFAEDFSVFAKSGAVSARGAERERGVLNFVARYIDEADRRYLETGTYRVEYLEYDWSLNDRR